MSETPMPPTGTKQWCCLSDWEVASPGFGEEEAAVLDLTPEEGPNWRQRNGRPLAKLLKKSHWEAFSKDSEIIKVARQAYHLSHKGMFAQEGSYDLMLVFREIATSAGLLDSDVHKVKDEWTGWKDLQATHQTAKSPLKDIHFFQLVPPTESPKIMGLKGIHSPKALKWQAGLLVCPWSKKEGQNQGTVVNHLCTMHYCLGLICMCLVSGLLCHKCRHYKTAHNLLWVPNYEG